MILMLTALVVGVDPSVELRHSFVQCLKSATEQAETQKIAADAFVGFVRGSCANAEAPFKLSLIKVDIAHGMSHGESDSDAQSQLHDYYSEWLDRYKTEAPAVKSAADQPKAAVSPATPPPTPAAQPK